MAPGRRRPRAWLGSSQECKEQVLRGNHKCADTCARETGRNRGMLHLQLLLLLWTTHRSLSYSSEIPNQPLTARQGDHHHSNINCTDTKSTSRVWKKQRTEHRRPWRNWAKKTLFRRFTQRITWQGKKSLTSLVLFTNTAEKVYFIIIHRNVSNWALAHISLDLLHGHLTNRKYYKCKGFF